MTNTDTQFTSRFSPLTLASFVANQSTLANFTPTTSPINSGMLSDIGRAMIFNPDIQESFWDRFIKNPLSRGDAVMSARFADVTSRAFDPTAADTELFNGQKPAMSSNVAKKNLDRQIAVEIHEKFLKQLCQTEEMIGDVASAIMASSFSCYKDDMWVAAKGFFSGSVRSALTGSLYTLTASPGETGFAEEMVEKLWDFCENKFAYKSTLYNPSGFNTKSSNIHIALKKSCEFPAFKKLYSETFNPEFIKVAQTIDYVDDFATPAGAPSGAGELLGIIYDDRACSITPVDSVSTETFRNPARESTTYFTHYSYIFQQDPFFNVAYIFDNS